jgi:pimeloyl-ACP methyl ester carboxylesterase
MPTHPIIDGRLDRSAGTSPRPELAWRKVEGAGPALVFLPGYASDMAGSKACAVLDWAAAHGRACILFDYAGCGQSDGSFADETLASWRDDALDILDRLATGPAILIGSSMGGWLMLLIALARPDQIAGLVGIAAAPDFTQWGYSTEQKAELQRDGQLFEDNPYGPEPTLTTLPLWQSGEDNLLLGAPIALDCPVRLLHGQADGDVPHSISLTLAAQLRSAQVVTTLVKDGDHRLSRSQDITLLIVTIEQLLATIESA